MPEISLLPEAMRQRERRELKRAAKQPKVFTVDLSQGQRQSPPIMIKPPQPRQTLGQKLFGRRAKPVAPVMPPRPPKINLESPVKARVSQPPVKPIMARPPFRPQRSFWSSLFGRPRFPIEAPKPAPPRPAPTMPSPPRPIKPSIIVRPEPASLPRSHRPSRPGWFKNLFAAKPPTAKIKKPEPATIKPPKEKSPAKYHMAPKAEKSQLDINLAPEELIARRYPRGREKVVAILLALVIPALIVSALYLVIDQQQRALAKKINTLAEEQKKLITYLDGFKDIQRQNIKVQDKLLALNDLLSGHIYWTKFFSLLERYTLDGVYYTEFTADTSGEFMLPAVATVSGGASISEQVADSYGQAASQIVAFQQAAGFVDQIKVNNLELVSSDEAGVKGVKFEINVELADGVFNKEFED